MDPLWSLPFQSNQKNKPYRNPLHQYARKSFCQKTNGHENKTQQKPKRTFLLGINQQGEQLNGRNKCIKKIYFAGIDRSIKQQIRSAQKNQSNEIINLPKIFFVKPNGHQSSQDQKN